MAEDLADQVVQVAKAQQRMDVARGLQQQLHAPADLVHWIHGRRRGEQRLGRGVVGLQGDQRQRIAQRRVGAAQRLVAGHGGGEHGRAGGDQRGQGGGIALGFRELAGRQVGVELADGGQGLFADHRHQRGGVGVCSLQRHKLFQGLDRLALGAQGQHHTQHHVRMAGPQQQQVLEQGQGVVGSAAEAQRLGERQELVDPQGIGVLRRIRQGGGLARHGRSRNWPYMSITWARLGPR